MDHRKNEGKQEQKMGQTESVEASRIIYGSKSGRGNENYHLDSTKLSMRPNKIRGVREVEK